MISLRVSHSVLEAIGRVWLCLRRKTQIRVGFQICGDFEISQRKLVGK